MSQSGSVSVVITDTSILINLSHTGHLRLLGATPGYRFLVSDEVMAEIIDPLQRSSVEEAITAALLERTSIQSTDELSAYAELRQVLGSGESACLALAMTRRWLVACDEKRVFLREAQARLGAGRIVNTPGLYILWIRSGILSVEDADAAKQILEANRFKMNFPTFRDLV